MAGKKIDLARRCFFVLSGVSNPLGSTLAIEMCRRFKPHSAVVLLDTSEEVLQEVKKEIRFLERDIAVYCCLVPAEHASDSTSIFREFIANALVDYGDDFFELGFIVHNEGDAATQRLMEPQDELGWKCYVKENLYSVVALNQAFLQATQSLRVAERLVVNITSSLLVKPLVFSGLMCSCKKARDMYFRSVANEEVRNGVFVMSYRPGIFETHKPEVDLNSNIIDLSDLENGDAKFLKLPRVLPFQSTLKLINILEEMSFISGHDVDYHDTYFL